MLGISRKHACCFMEKIQISVTIASIFSGVKNSIISCVLYWLNITGYRVSLLAQAFHWILRTLSVAIVSEATIMWYLRKYFFHFMKGNPGLVITQLIKNEQEKSGKQRDLQAS